jgi:hypothetical protein
VRVARGSLMTGLGWPSEGRQGQADDRYGIGVGRKRQCDDRYGWVMSGRGRVMIGRGWVRAGRGRVMTSMARTVKRGQMKNPLM